MKKEKDFDIRYNHRESDRSHIEKSVYQIDFLKNLPNYFSYSLFEANIY